MDEEPEKSIHGPPYEVLVLGRVSEMTRGSTILYPWFEASPPPFDRWCPKC